MLQSSTPPRDVLPALRELTQWRNAARVGAAVSLPPAIGVALLDLALGVLVAARGVPNPQHEKQVTTLLTAVEANRLSCLSMQARQLFAGGRHV